MGKDEQGNGRIKKISSERRDAAENRRSPSLERTLRDIEQISLRVQEDALALELFLAGEAAPAVQKVFDAAVATHAHACHLLSVESLPRTPPPTTSRRVTVAVPSTRLSSRRNRRSRRGVDSDYIDDDDDTQSTASGGLTPDREYNKRIVAGHQYRASPPRGGNGNAGYSVSNEPKRRFDCGDSLATGGGSYALAPQQQPRRPDNRGGDGERTRRHDDGNEGSISTAGGFSNTTDDMGLAVVEVLRVSAKSASEEQRGGDGGGEGDETDESEGGISRTVTTDISAKIVGLSALIRKKAAEASANWRRKN